MTPDDVTPDLPPGFAVDDLQEADLPPGDAPDECGIDEDGTPAVEGDRDAEGES